MDATRANSGPASGGTHDSWSGRPAWTILSTHFGNGLHFLASCAAWRADPARSHMLHYVGILAPGQTPARDDCVKPDSGLLESAMTQQLHRACASLQGGFQRITFERGLISLTLCRERLVTALGELDCSVDAIYVDAGGLGNAILATDTAEAWDKWTVQLLARRCRRGTRLRVTGVGDLPGQSIANPWTERFQSQGFEWDAPKPDTTDLQGTFNPQWKISRSRSAARAAAIPITRVAVIGAGLAGASVARALALRGWDVSVFDQHAEPAKGASGLPVGLVVPQVSADDNARSRMSRSGVALTLQNAHDLLSQGFDWEMSGVRELRTEESSLWHAQAAWLKPAKLVQAWLAHPRIRFIGNAHVGNMEKNQHVWVLRGGAAEPLGQAEIVVFANAMGCAPLLLNLVQTIPLVHGLADNLRALQATHGTLSSGRLTEDLSSMPESPVNGHGSFVPRVPEATGMHWYAGSTFETQASAMADVNAQHSANLNRLCELLPDVGKALAPDFHSGRVASWSNTRCVPHDRLPLVGPIEAHAPSSLWICAGMGARGLSFSALCAQLLAARISAEPLPLEFSLAKSLEPDRSRGKRAQPAAD